MSLTPSKSSSGFSLRWRSFMCVLDVLTCWLITLFSMDPLKVEHQWHLIDSLSMSVYQANGFGRICPLCYLNYVQYNTISIRHSNSLTLLAGGVDEKFPLFIDETGWPFDSSGSHLSSRCSMTSVHSLMWIVRNLCGKSLPATSTMEASAARRSPSLSITTYT